LQHSRECLCKESFACSRRTDKHDVRLLNLDIRTPFQHLDPLVVLVNRDCELLLGFLLTDHVLVQKDFDLLRLRKGRPRRSCFLLRVIAYDLNANVYALIADVYGRAGDEFLDLILALAAETAAQCVFASSHYLAASTLTSPMF